MQAMSDGAVWTMQYKEKVVRDLVWVFISPNVFSPDAGPAAVPDDWGMRLAQSPESQAWLQRMDDNPAELFAFLKAQKQIRTVGHYFAALIEYWIRESPLLRASKVVCGLQVEGDVGTCGRLKMLSRLPDSVVPVPESCVAAEPTTSLQESSGIKESNTAQDIGTEACRTADASWHLECSIKYYVDANPWKGTTASHASIGTVESIGTDVSHAQTSTTERAGSMFDGSLGALASLVGPFLHENCLWRAEELSRKLAIASDPEVCAWIKQLMETDCVRSSSFVRGFIFYPVAPPGEAATRTNAENLPGLSPRHPRGWLARSIDEVFASTSSDSLLCVLPKLHWLSPVVAAADTDNRIMVQLGTCLHRYSQIGQEPVEALSRADFATFVSQHFAARPCQSVLLAELAPQSPVDPCGGSTYYAERSRGFLLCKGWDPSQLCEEGVARGTRNRHEKPPEQKGTQQRLRYRGSHNSTTPVVRKPVEPPSCAAALLHASRNQTMPDLERTLRSIPVPGLMVLEALALLEDEEDLELQRQRGHKLLTAMVPRPQQKLKNTCLGDHPDSRGASGLGKPTSAQAMVQHTPVVQRVAHHLLRTLAGESRLCPGLVMKAIKVLMLAAPPEVVEQFASVGSDVPRGMFQRHLQRCMEEMDSDGGCGRMRMAVDLCLVCGVKDILTDTLTAPVLDGLVAGGDATIFCRVGDALPQLLPLLRQRCEVHGLSKIIPKLNVHRSCQFAPEGRSVRAANTVSALELPGGCPVYFVDDRASAERALELVRAAMRNAQKAGRPLFVGFDAEWQPPAKSPQGAKVQRQKTSKQMPNGVGKFSEFERDASGSLANKSEEQDLTQRTSPKPPGSQRECISPVAVFQLATPSDIFVFDMFAPGVVERSGALAALLALTFGSADSPCIAVGFGASNDLRRLVASYPEIFEADKNDNVVLRFAELQDIANECLGVAALDGSGLSSLCIRAIGHRIEKVLQLSDWGNRPLSSAQIRYAAIDAYAVLRVVDAVVQEDAKMDPCAHLQKETFQSQPFLQSCDVEKAICELGLADDAAILRDDQIPQCAMEVKTLAWIAHPGSAPVVTLVHAEDAVCLPLLQSALGAQTIRLATPQELCLRFGFRRGTLGPLGVREATSVRTVVDDALVGKTLLCGAGEEGLSLCVSACALSKAVTLTISPIVNRSA